MMLGFLILPEVDVRKSDDVLAAPDIKRAQ